MTEESRSANTNGHSDKKVIKWYRFHPSDTLFLRGSEPMVSSTSHETTQLFPPQLSVISGAVRTAVLAQRSISIARYERGDQIEDFIGKYGHKAPFNIIGPLLCNGSDYFVPAPYTWYVEEDKSEKREKHIVTVLESEALAPAIIDSLGLKSSSSLTGWVKQSSDIKTVGGSWVSLTEMLKGERTFREGETIFRSGEESTRVFSREERIGIAMDCNRNVKESQLYMARHIRLKPEFSIVWGVDRDCGLADQGVISLGGEQRFGHYKLIDPQFNLIESGSRHLALSSVEVTEKSAAALIASGRIVYRGGWDLAKQFHKDMRGYYPAGSVFSAPVDHCTILF